ncbi:hypothetical protein [Prauserella cavernicola]|uniref:Uncharacterized protein n=1 Tax=Prauserella cavernicola TaxID=2800127 RepID=A0A934V9G1_9PSEU|nr:hypothetical protein [Prauserella cavernicola]MBK1788803.1 hypothetical protein [Prauserella cavernicola]
MPSFPVLSVADTPPHPDHLGLWSPIPDSNTAGLLDYVSLVVDPDTAREVIVQTRPARQPDDEVPPGQYGMLVPSAHMALLAVDDANAESPEGIAGALADGHAPWEPVELVIDDDVVRGWRASFPEQRVTVAAHGDVTIGVVDRPGAPLRDLRTVSPGEMTPWAGRA